MIPASESTHSDTIAIGRQSGDGVFIYQIEQKRFTYTNPAFTEIFNVTADTLHLQSAIVLQDIMSEDQTYLRSSFDELMKNGCISGAEFRLQLQKDGLKHLACDAFLFDQNNTIAGFVKDITLAKEHENYLVEYTAKKDAFLDMITHNLSGPLILSQNILEWVRRSVSKNETINLDSLINLLQESTQQCIDIVNDFLLEEHQQSQFVYVRKTRFNVIEKINAVLEKMKELNPDKQFNLITNLENVNLNSDSVKFFQVIHNLISNAIKFTLGNGKIDIIIDESDKSFIFSIKDNGIGIPTELKEHIFDKRSIAGREGMKGERSNGIGLSIVKKLVELIDGQIWFESEENKGTVFHITLPKE